ncbi:MAG: GNAT family N-acetyltransferase, partial [Nocardioides sp.]
MTNSPVSVPSLRDGDVVLRALTEQDVEGCYEQCVDPQSVRWTHAPNPYSREMARDYCLVVVPRKWAEDSEWTFAVEHEGVYAGNIALRNDGHGRAEVAYGA